MQRRKQSSSSDGVKRRRPGRSSAKAEPKMMSLEKVLGILTVLAIIIFYAAQNYMEPAEPEGILVIPEKTAKTVTNKPSKAEASAVAAPDAEFHADDPKDDGVKYHVVFSTGCSPFQDWQSYGKRDQGSNTKDSLYMPTGKPD